MINSTFLEHNILKHPLSLLFVFVTTLFAILYGLHLADTGDYDWYILVFISSVYTSSVLFMLIQTPWAKWTILGSGMVATFSADAILYGLFAANQILGHRITGYEFGLGLVRALFIMGGIWLVIGMVQDAWLDQSERSYQRWIRIFDKLHILKGKNYHGNDSSFDHSDN